MNKKKKGFSKANKTNAWTILVLIIVFIMALQAIFMVIVDSFLRYVVDAKLRSEGENIRYMAWLVDSAGDDGSAVALLGGSERDWVIRDANGETLHVEGRDTCGSDPQAVRLFTSQETVDICPDKEQGFIYPRKGSLSFRLPDDISDESDLKTLLGKIDQGGKVRFPFWIATPLKDGTTLYGKSVFVFDRFHLAYSLGMLVAFVALVLFQLILLVILFISGILRQQLLTKVFFMDDITNARNWMWLHINGTKVLCRRKYAKTRFALVGMAFVNYHNFCLCHSVAEGEELLREIDHRIRRALNKDEFCARHVGAEFAVLVQYVERDDLKNRITEILEDLESIDNTHKLSFHVGVALIPIATDNNGKIVRRREVDLDANYNYARAASATIKDSDASGIVFFDEALMEEQKWIDTVQENQKAALANEEFEVYYQPKYDPKTDELRGAEALIRWNSPKYGFKGPGAFIPIFESNGFIKEIDHYMVSHVARDQRAWLDQGYKCIPVSVNISRAHFIETDLAEQISKMVDEAGTPHELIELEVTESAFFDDKQAMIETIKKLKDNGFEVSMDDFGSGYSSLNSLKDMPLDVLKLDAEFFRGEAEAERKNIVVSEAIRLAKNLNMRTVAEGVEDKDQVDFLAGQGCDMIQGYFYAKPMPKTDFEKRMKKTEEP
ncbi:MAG: GGDEF domain-containing phosphodiesterase [Lachnospiraceae bacterium]|nr:GGDEF domain-containing phosphodiesterase [Lachnospiraceae bacterium]